MDNTGSQPSQQSGVIIAPRTADDLAALAQIFEATFEASGYPVEGPPTLDPAAVPALVEYFSGPRRKNSGASWLLTTVAAMLMVVRPQRRQSRAATALATAAALRPQPPRRGGRCSAMSGVPPSMTTTAAPPAADDGLWGVSRLAIDPAVQKRGVGGRLMDHVEQEARHASKTLVLGVLDKDVAAIRMYERRGWVRFGQEEGFAGRDGRMWTMYYYGLSNHAAPPS
ncbi:uncharacterized protein PG986_001988 [Apiospora aurea]|uniref:N-acetyltransferase domain-containing protein n=1 Tax=Apiospora aurea TaxID=335848 RepID=A0ABR1QZE4_9PEZI